MEGSGGDKVFQELGEAAGHGVDISPRLEGNCTRSFEEVNREVGPLYLSDACPTDLGGKMALRKVNTGVGTLLAIPSTSLHPLAGFEIILHDGSLWRPWVTDSQPKQWMSLESRKIKQLNCSA